MDRWKELLNPEGGINDTENEGIKHRDFQRRHDNVITEKKVKQTIRCTKRGKAADHDKIAPKILKSMGQKEEKC